MFVLEHAPNENAARVEKTVKEVCDYAISVASPANLQVCYTAENASNTEYICTASDICHVEEK